MNKGGEKSKSNREGSTILECQSLLWRMHLAANLTKSKHTYQTYQVLPDVFLCFSGDLASVAASLLIALLASQHPLLQRISKSHIWHFLGVSAVLLTK